MTNTVLASCAFEVQKLSMPRHALPKICVFMVFVFLWFEVGRLARPGWTANLRTESVEQTDVDCVGKVDVGFDGFAIASKANLAKTV